MPQASPELRRLRVRTGIKAGEWAQRVRMHRVSYAQVEGGRNPGSPELFSRCAALLSELLGEAVDPARLMLDPEDEEEDHEHTDAGTGPPNRGDSTGPGRLRPDLREAS